VKKATVMEAMAAPATLSQSESERIDAYWRAANYLSAGQIYLLDE
jgi:xylulose-5-phosphate/fructose-6-phosphate phosphoketolase